MTCSEGQGSFQMLPCSLHSPWLSLMPGYCQDCCSLLTLHTPLAVFNAAAEQRAAHDSNVAWHVDPESLPAETHLPERCAEEERHDEDEDRPKGVVLCTKQHVTVSSVQQAQQLIHRGAVDFSSTVETLRARYIVHW